MFDFLDNAPQRRKELFTKLASLHLSSMGRLAQGDLEERARKLVEDLAKKESSDSED
jgi:hypothetical protein